MKYLDYSNMPRFLRHFANTSGSRDHRLVGVDGAYDSGYYDIVRFFGPDAVRPHQVVMDYLPGRFRFTDALIRDFAGEMESRLRAEGRLYEGPTVMQLAALDLATFPMTMTVRECSYGEQAGSCFALDWPHPQFDQWGGTLREYYKTRYPSTELEENPLAICLGVCGYVIASWADEPVLVQVKRSGKLASLEKSLGPSAAGVVDYTTDWKTLAELIEQSMQAEITEELGLEPEEYELTPLAYAREIFRGERPQLFTLATTELSAEDVAERLRRLPAEGREFSEVTFVPVEQSRDLRDRWLASLNHEARMSWYMIEEYLASC